MHMLPQPNKIEDTILVTHKGCLDGAGCAIMFLCAGGREENIRYVTAGMVEKFIKSDPAFTSSKFLIFADIGLNTSKYADMMEKRGNLVVIDHHKTSLHMADREWARIDMNGCGTTLLREYLISLDSFDPEKSGMPKDTSCFGRVLKSSSYRCFAETIDDFDRFFMKLPDSLNLADLMTFTGQSEFVKMFHDPKERWCQNISEGRGKRFLSKFDEDVLRIIQMRRDEQIADAIKRCMIRTIVLPDESTVTVGYIISSIPYVSLLLDKLLKDNSKLQVGAQINIDRGMVSLRSRGGYDVSKMAEMFGGGGHAAAAGHSLQSGIKTNILDEVHNG